ncbi:hypothetical protein [Parenemella sanctibonifatiensis]|uniref:Uncharacterized protein n=1 Tax=Parenemella sanctibonifatiensis TaxID=2016505 RepID=A0A255EDA6_9ACTN|nr:hypothetical protein [Parenemella sanctibonifatiensis]OYN89529.1 hypothetical protein CGZ91_11635 [Parenemella sanctibonifatiensis]
MTDTATLRELHRELVDNRDKFEGQISHSREIAYSDWGLQYSVYGKSVDSDQEMHWLFKNDPATEKKYATPSVGSIFSYSDGSPAYLYGEHIEVMWWESSPQEEVQACRDDLEKAQEEGGTLSMMNETDLDSLVEVPQTLARTRETLQDARSTFETRKAEAETLSGAGGPWSGGGYTNYTTALSAYISRFDTMISDIDNLMDAHPPLVDRVVDLCNAVLQVYIDSVDECIGLLKGGISLTSGVPSWQSAASAALDVIGDAVTKHHEELQEKLTELRDTFEFQALVDTASNIDLGPWPLPQGIDNTWTD